MASFEWDEEKNQENIRKHGLSFFEAQKAFFDPHRCIVKDNKHSTKAEIRYFCYGIVNEKVCTVRFVYKNNKIRVFGAGYWRKEKKIYEANI